MAEYNEKSKSGHTLLFVVVFMGVLLLAGLILVIGTIMFRATNIASDAPSEFARSQPFAHRLDIPYDMEVVDITSLSGRIIVHLRPRNQDQGGGDLLLYLDTITGEELGRVMLAPAPADPVGM